MGQRISYIQVHMIEIIGSYETITTTKLAEKLGITKVQYHK